MGCEVRGLGQDLLQEDMGFQFFGGVKDFHAVSASDQLMEISSVLSESIPIGHENQCVLPTN
jgi:hypothetical protein